MGFLVLFFANFNYFQKQTTYFFGTHRSTEKTQEAVSVAGKPNLLSISILGIQAPVVYTEEISEKAFQSALQNGVVHYPGTALPGQKGNVYIFGHSSDYAWSKGSYKTVFALLPKIKKGESIEISDQLGAVYVYKVTETFVASPEDLYLLEQDKSKNILTLQTSYPIGTAFKRWIVRAELVDK